MQNLNAEAGRKDTLERLAAVDLSHTIEHGLVTYRGLPAPIICDYLSREASRAVYAPGTEFHIGKIEMVANTGTYVDSPYHRYAQGRDLSQLELWRLADVETVVVRCRAPELAPAGTLPATPRSRAIDVDMVASMGAGLRGKAVLFDTGWDRHFASEQYFSGHPFLTEAAARYLVQAGPAVVGIDSLNIDDTAGGQRPVHSLLLGADIPIVEHLTQLGRLPSLGARFFAVPVKVRGFGTFPVRAFALCPGIDGE
jgi:arylformamidase